MKYLFAGVELDTGRREISRSGEEVLVQPQVFDVLALLVANSHRMLSKEELLDTVWGDRFVSESALSSRIKAARQAVGDNGRDQNVIRTIHGRGFAMVADVTTAENEEESTSQNGSEAAVSIGPTMNLPRRRIQLIGREDEIARASEILAHNDLVSIVGTGGVGKTSLAIEVAQRALDAFPGGVWICELAQVVSSSLGSAISGAITGGAGTASVGAPDVADVVSSEPTLLILDNCEHIVDSVATFVDELREACPTLSILTTTREALGVRGEHVLRLQGLDHANPTDAAIDLFLERANEVGELSVDASMRDVVVDIVTRLEGLPLAIELAAPRLTSMGLNELLSALDDQLLILDAGRRHDGRQSAMDRAISWSYDLLTDEERTTLQQFGVFAGAFSIEAASAVTTSASLPQILHRLVEQSMVARVTRGHTTRYRLLEPTRQFVEREIDDELRGLAVERHAVYFCNHVAEIAADLWTESEAQVADTLTAEWADISRSIAWARSEQEFDLAMRPLTALGPHMLYQQRHEALEWVDQVLEESAGKIGAELLPEAMLLSCLRAFSSIDQALARTRHEAAVEAYGPSALSGLMGCYVEIIGSDFERLAAAGDEFWDLALAEKDPKWIGIAAAYRLIGRALADPADGDIDELVSEVDQHLGGATESSISCWCLLSRLTLAIRSGDGDGASHFHNELRRATGECRAPWFAQIGGGLIAQSQGDANDPVDYLTRVVDSVRATVRTQELTHYSLVFRAAVVALEEVGDSASAAQIVGLLEQVHDVGAIRRTLSSGYGDAVARMTETLGVEEFEQLVTAGRRLTPRAGVNLCEEALVALEHRTMDLNESPVSES